MSETKKIAIVGGGSAGLVTAYLLHKKCDITLFEKQTILGGNVRTLNKNVSGTKLPSTLNIENGVLGFSQEYYPNFHKLLEVLKVPYTYYKPSISLFCDNQFFPARSLSYLNFKTLIELLKNSNYRSEVYKLSTSQKEFEEQIRKSQMSHKTFSDFKFSQEVFKHFMQALFMLSFSTAFDLVPQLPQRLINDYFLALPNSDWSFIKGGVYSYMNAILEQTHLKLVLNAKDIKITRHKDHVSLKCNGESSEFDAVIIATTPGSVRQLLTDMTEDEAEIFNDWENQLFKTIAHTDNGFYGKHKHVRKTPMDLFYNFSDKSIGYNTYQNRGYQLPTDRDYCFAYGLDAIIDKGKILDVQDHVVPKYSKEHDSKIDKLQHINGSHRTFFAGAYLDNGLHEGSVNSALFVSKKLNGLKL